MAETFPLHPFKSIALGLSGGGFRAASYSLGHLSYLHHLKYPQPGNACTVLENVHFISSASGGTITAALYSAAAHKGETFIHCYKKLSRSVLKGEDLLTTVLEKLQDDNEWNKPGDTKRRNLINSFAKVYDEKIFNSETFGVFDTGKSKLEVCFNAVEFSFGLPFRFQGNSQGVTGNNYVQIDKQHKEALHQLKLGDILAASSCFPGGFEPIVYPDDFSHTQLSNDELRKHMLVKNYSNEKKPLSANETIGLMDGGITDNQGLDSAILADKRRRKQGNPFDLILITDVTSYFMDAYTVPPPNENTGWRNASLQNILDNVKKGFRIFNLATVLAGLLFITSLIGIFTFSHSIARNVSLVAAGAFGIVLLIRIVINIFVINKNKALRSFIKNPDTADINTLLQEKLPAVNNFSPPIVQRLFSFFKTTKLGLLEQMILARVNSVLTMTFDIFLKHIRRKIFLYFYDDVRWENRRANNFIYELSEGNKTFRKESLLEKPWGNDHLSLLEPTPVMNTIASAARNMGTTLWFDGNDTKADKLKQLIAAGQFTSCVNLLEYCINLEYQLQQNILTISEADKNILLAIRHQLENDWAHFKADPYFLYNQFEKEIDVN